MSERKLHITFEIDDGAYRAETTMDLDADHAEEFAEFCDMQLKFIAMHKTGTKSEYKRFVKRPIKDAPQA